MPATFTCDRCGYVESPMRHSLGCNGVYEPEGSGYRCPCGDYWYPSGDAWCVGRCGGWTSRYTVRDHAVSGSCFPGDVRVWTPTGPRRIDDVVVGSQIISFDPSARRFVARPITGVLTHPGAHVCHLEFSSRRAPLRTTANHSFLTERGWLRADRLVRGDRLVANGSAPEARVETVKFSMSVEPVYNLITAGEHTFVVEGVVAHNFTFAPALRTLIHEWFSKSLPAPPAPEEARPSASPDLSHP